MTSRSNELDKKINLVNFYVYKELRYKINFAKSGKKALVTLHLGIQQPPVPTQKIRYFFFLLKIRCR
jgi:hypothetical protein